MQSAAHGYAANYCMETLQIFSLNIYLRACALNNSMVRRRKAEGEKYFFPLLQNIKVYTASILTRRARHM